MKKSFTLLTFFITLGTIAVLGQTTYDSLAQKTFEGRKGNLIVPADDYFRVENCCAAQFSQRMVVPTPIPKLLQVVAKEATKAIAVSDGRVVTVTRVPGIPFFVIVKHGDYYSIYSNLQTVEVSTGQLVTFNQSLGTIKTVDGETVLNFEVRKGTEALDPAEWVAMN